MRKTIQKIFFILPIFLTDMLCGSEFAATPADTPSVYSKLNAIPEQYQPKPYLYKFEYENKAGASGHFYVWLTNHIFPIERTIPENHLRKILKKCHSFIAETSHEYTGKMQFDQELLNSLFKNHLMIGAAAPDNAIQYARQLADLTSDKQKNGFAITINNWWNNITIQSRIFIRDSILSLPTEKAMFASLINPYVVSDYIKQTYSLPLEHITILDSSIKTKFNSLRKDDSRMIALDSRETRFGDEMLSSIKAELDGHTTSSEMKEALLFLNDIPSNIISHQMTMRKDCATELIDYFYAAKKLSEMDHSAPICAVRDRIWPQTYIPFIQNFEVSEAPDAFMICVGLGHGQVLFETLLQATQPATGNPLIKGIRRFDNGAADFIPVDHSDPSAW